MLSLNFGDFIKIDKYLIFLSGFFLPLVFSNFTSISFLLLSPCFCSQSFTATICIRSPHSNANLRSNYFSICQQTQAGYYVPQKKEKGYRRQVSSNLCLLKNKAVLSKDDIKAGASVKISILRLTPSYPLIPLIRPILSLLIFEVSNPLQHRGKLWPIFCSFSQATPP
jgi:hypothetical protein